jgi:hypothetical protein
MKEVYQLIGVEEAKNDASLHLKKVLIANDCVREEEDHKNFGSRLHDEDVSLTGSSEPLIQDQLIYKTKSRANKLQITPAKGNHSVFLKKLGKNYSFYSGRHSSQYLN